MAKIGLSAIIALLVAPTIPAVTIPDYPGAYTLLVVEEVVVGLAMGLIVSIVVNAIYLAGQMIDVPIGFGMVNVIDPQTGMQIPIVAQFKYVLAILILFTINAHHFLIAGMAQSFSVLPVGFAALDAPAVTAVGIETFGTMFLLALRIGLPIVAALFVTDVALGIVARAVPQINVFFVGIPLKIGLGFLLLVFVLPTFVGLITGIFGEEGEMMRALYRLITALREE